MASNPTVFASSGCASIAAMTKGEPILVRRVAAKAPVASIMVLEETGVTTVPAPSASALSVPMTSPGITRPVASVTKGRSASPSVETMAS